MIQTQEIMASLQTMPLLTISSESTISKCRNLPVQKSDIFICSYPKSGTTWTQHIVVSLLLLHREKTGHRLSYDHVSDYAPFFEIDSHWSGEDLHPEIQIRQEKLGHRVFNTHLRGNMLPEGPAKRIYVIRSPLDTCVSFYHHLSHQVEGCYKESLDKFLSDWIDGQVPFGSWIDHVLSFAPLIADERAFFISYKDMVNDLSNVVQRLVKYLGLNDGVDKGDGGLSVDDIKQVLPSFSFDNMKKNLSRFQPKSVT